MKNQLSVLLCNKNDSYMKKQNHKPGIVQSKEKKGSETCDLKLDGSPLDSAWTRHCQNMEMPSIAVSSTQDE